MKYLLSSFSQLFTLFFAIPFPMLLYYNIKNENPPDLAGTNPWIALALVVLSMGLWTFLLTGYFRNWILSVFKAKRNIELLKKEEMILPVSPLPKIWITSIKYNEVRYIDSLHNYILWLQTNIQKCGRHIPSC